MIEEDIEFETAGLFYNPHMRFSRSISSLIVGSINEKKLNIIDGFASSGIRGLRYIKENPNVESLTFVDWSQHSINTAMENAKKNNIEKVNGIQSDFNKFMINEYSETTQNFIEIDPFGSPYEYIPIIMYTIQKQKEIYLSTTATDVRVLCGPEGKAAERHYLARTLNNMFTHETGTRVLLGYIFRMGLQYNFDMIPIISVSHRHHIKVIVKLVRNSENAMKSLHKNIGYVSYCPVCSWTTASKFPKECKKHNKENKTEYAGPMWLGKLHNEDVIKRAIQLNEQREYADKEKLDEILNRMIEENDLPPYFFNPGKVVKGEIKKIDEIIDCLNDKGFRASKTHFSTDGIKTDSDIDTFKECAKK